jgi:DNA-directed RNA polymerase subunit M/transcription elongation factor TFIIS
MTENLVTIGRYSTPYEANMVKSQLESAGIPAFVADEHVIGMNWLYSNALGGVKVQVPESLASEALEILASETEAPQTREPDAETCPECGSNNTEDFLDKRNSFLTLVLLGFPLLLPAEKKRCNDCGHRWRPSK